MPCDSAISRIRTGVLSRACFARAMTARHAYSAFADNFMGPSVSSPDGEGLRLRRCERTPQWRGAPATFRSVHACKQLCRVARGTKGVPRLLIGQAVQFRGRPAEVARMRGDHLGTHDETA